MWCSMLCSTQNSKYMSLCIVPLATRVHVHWPTSDYGNHLNIVHDSCPVYATHIFSTTHFYDGGHYLNFRWILQVCNLISFYIVQDHRERETHIIIITLLTPSHSCTSILLCIWHQSPFASDVCIYLHLKMNDLVKLL